jgi:hypothetical protein
MARAPKATIRHREQQAVALHLAGKKFDEIAKIVGYSDRGAAYNATMRAIKRETVEDIGEIRNVEIVRIDAMLDSVSTALSASYAGPDAMHAEHPGMR